MPWIRLMSPIKRAVHENFNTGVILKFYAIVKSLKEGTFQQLHSKHSPKSIWKWPCRNAHTVTDMEIMNNRIVKAVLF